MLAHEQAHYGLSVSCVGADDDLKNGPQTVAGG